MPDQTFSNILVEYLLMSSFMQIIITNYTNSPGIIITHYKPFSAKLMSQNRERDVTQ